MCHSWYSVSTLYFGMQGTVVPLTWLYVTFIYPEQIYKRELFDQIVISPVILHHIVYMRLKVTE